MAREEKMVVVVVAVTVHPKVVSDLQPWLAIPWSRKPTNNPPNRASVRNKVITERESESVDDDATTTMMMMMTMKQSQRKK